MSISFSNKGDWSKTTNFLKRAKHNNFLKQLDKYGKEGVVALSQATPKDTGLTAMSWSYEIHYSNGVYEITWTNNNLAEPGMPVAILIQYGHGVKGGGFVKGIDYINPALEPIFKKMAYEAWEEVNS